jgi:maltooligosyltrehalose trehalohydrolase
MNENDEWRLPFGANPEGWDTRFRVWAPGHERVDVILYGPGPERVQPLRAEDEGYFSALAEGVGAGSRYRYRLDGADTYPDPASRSQPDGVHEPSEVVDPGAFRWTDHDWRGLPLEELLIYELHVGTFTEDGTFDAVAEQLPYLRELGVTAIELMPVADFPGQRNWGYDGVCLYAPARVYGGSEALKRLVDAAHRHGLAVLLDVVYNHFGPEGNYLPAITSGKIFTEAHQTPWGAAINYDGASSRAVREFVIQNALYWIHEYHLDGLRLDATHAIIDTSAKHLLQELVERVEQDRRIERDVVLIAEDDRNERRLVTPIAEGGYGLDAVWADDFHHQLRRLTAGDREGYYANYSGTVTDLGRTLERGWYYEGQIYPERGKPRGTSAAGIPAPRFVHTLQNHDQVGNRALGERLHHQIDPAAFRAATALLLLSPYTPLLFMGQEWAASTPFLYFTDHPEELGRLVTRGRREEFEGFSAFSDPAQRARIPDPQDPDTFRRSVLRWAEQEDTPHRPMLQLYRELLALRRTHPAARERSRKHFAVRALEPGGLTLQRRAVNGAMLLVVCAFAGPLTLDVREFGGRGGGCAAERLRLWTEDERFGGDAAAPSLEQGKLHLPSTGAAVLE